MSEQWREVIGFPQYEVSDLGRVRSWRSRNGRGFATRPHVLKCGSFQDSDYQRVGLTDALGQLFSKRVHILVLEAFVGPQPFNMEACHNDGDPTNNTLANLRWDTRKANMDDQVKHGTRLVGDRHPNVVLSDAQVREIREAITAAGAKYGINRQLARRFGVSDSCISTIKREVSRKEA